MNDTLILTMIDKFSAGSIAELDFSNGTTRLLLRKESAFSALQSSCALPGTGAAALSLPGNSPVALEETGECITSPMVATFYASSSPDAPPFVKAGSKVKAGDALCILEAMKMMNRLEAEFDCEILAVKAASGDLVEYEQPLFEIKRL